MKNIIGDLDKAFESRVRLGIMSVLMVNDAADFNTIKENLDLTDGNLASHLKALEKIEYVIMNKEFVGRKPRTTYKASELGRQSFKQHLAALEKFIKGE